MGSLQHPAARRLRRLSGGAASRGGVLLSGLAACAVPIQTHADTLLSPPTILLGGLREADDALNALWSLPPDSRTRQVLMRNIGADTVELISIMISFCLDYLRSYARGTP